MSQKCTYLEGTHDSGVMTPVKECDMVDEAKFKKIVEDGQPVVMRRCPFGDCTHKWTLDYLTETLGDQEVVIHESKVGGRLDFLTKNFTYKKCKFSEFAQKVRDQDSQRTVYLRSTNKDPRSKQPARIEDDFPTLADDLHPPPFIPYGKLNERYHSSILRISSKHSRLWMHFDLYDNVLCQVAGIKTVYLFPPTDSKFLYLDGDKSLVQDIDDWPRCIGMQPDLLRSHPLEVDLQPGDCLFIPSMWWHLIILRKEHNQDGHSIGFNIFWKDERLEQESLYASNDVYGNKNLPRYDAALANLDKAMQHLEKLPGKYGEVYREMFYREAQKRIGRREDNR